MKCAICGLRIVMDWREECFAWKGDVVENMCTSCFRWAYRILVLRQKG